MKLELAKENLFKMKSLNYFEALESKMELIKNKEKLEFDIEDIKIIKSGEKYYLKNLREDLDNYKISQAEKEI